MAQRPAPRNLPALLANDPSIDYRGGVLPFLLRTVTDIGGDDISEFQQTELATPALLYDPAQGMARTGAMAMGHIPVDPNVVAQTAFDAPLVGNLFSTVTNAVPRGAVGANVFHGGPHRWSPEPDFPHGRPRLDKIGTGEGAQAYGYGFYSADAPGVAKQYKQDLSGFDELVLTTSKGKLRGEALDDVDLEVAKYLELGEKDAGQFKHNTVYYAKKLAEKAGRDDVLKRLDEYGPDARKSYEKNVGTLYKLDIPDADIAKYLDWDKPLSEQPKSVRDALKAYGNFPDNMKGSQIYESIASMLAKPPFDSSMPSTKNPSAAQAASEALRKAGIPGLKYFDQDSRRSVEIFVDGKQTTPVGARNIAEKESGWLVGQLVDRGAGAITLGTDPKKAIIDEAVYQGRTINKDEIDAAVQKATTFIDRIKAGEKTRNYVTWDQDVLNRSKMLERDGITLGANKGPTAALPGLLDDTASRMQRAQDMGFDVDAYHGTRGDFIQFEKGDLGFHFGSPEQATNRLRQTEKVFGSEGANIIPAKINVNKSLELPDLGQWNDPAVVAAGIIERGGAFGRKYGNELQEIQQEADNLKRQFEDGDAWVESMEAADLLAEIQWIIKRDGYDSVKYLNEMENKMGDRGGFTIEGQKKYNALNKQFHELTKKIAQRDTPAPELGASEAEISRWLNRKPTEPTAAESKRLKEIARAKEEVERTGTYSPYSYIVFDPENIRSSFAKFDPAKADSADLLAANPVTAALPSLLDWSNRADREIRKSAGMLNDIIRGRGASRAGHPMRNILGDYLYSATTPDGAI